MIHWSRKKRPISPFLLLAVALLLTGCTPEEKTLILPMTSVSTEEQENDDPSKDFTVKKIYTYSYTTREGIEKSAFLQGCGENEIHIIAQEGTEDTVPLTYREVDYRYGFHDTLGDFFTSWENWLNPSDGLSSGECYIEKLLPSPDGTQLLVYIRSAFQDLCIVWLYRLGTEKPVVIYEGALPAGGDLEGSFSPSGRWMTYDAAGYSSGKEDFVPVYDCQKDFPPVDEADMEYLTDARIYPPDQKIGVVRKAPSSILCSELYDIPDNVGLLSFLLDSDATVSFYQDYNPKQLVLLGGSGEEGNIINSDTYTAHYSRCLEHFDGMHFIQYTFDQEEYQLYYLGKPSRLWRFNTDRPENEISERELPANTAPEAETELFEFPQNVWDFQRLESGGFLAVLVQEYNNYGITPPESKSPLKLYGSLLAVQEFWDIRSADLYLYPEGESEGKLLYKNLQNLISMEYDAQNRRILLETWEGDNVNQRTCIILEL